MRNFDNLVNNSDLDKVMNSFFIDDEDDGRSLTFGKKLLHPGLPKYSKG